MNKSDIKLIALLIFVALLLFLFLSLKKDASFQQAYIYYDNQLVKTVNLSINQTRTFEVKGYKGTVVFETKKNQIRVKEEISPLHLCSKMGYISKSYETIVCLPNKIVVKLKSDDDTIDIVVR